MDNLEKDILNCTKQFSKDLYKGIVDVMTPILVEYKDNIEKINAQANAKILKREREQTPLLNKEDSSNSSSSDSPVLSKKVKKSKEEEGEDTNNPIPDFECPGTIWTDPIVPCKKGTRAHIKDGIQIIGENGKKKNITLCRDCKNIRTREKRAEKKK